MMTRSATVIGRKISERLVSGRSSDTLSLSLLHIEVSLGFGLQRGNRRALERGGGDGMGGSPRDDPREALCHVVTFLHRADVVVVRGPNH